MLYKNILYLGIVETYYSRGIKKSLKKIAKGVDCFFFYDILILPVYMKEFSPKKSNKLRFEKINSFINYLAFNHYDAIFVDGVGGMPFYFFEKIKHLFKNIPIINYNYSSIKKYNFLPYQDCFTKIYSFDPKDCKKYDLNYLPLFYLNEFENIGIGNRKRYDISFIGSGFSPGRLQFFNNLVKSGKLAGLKKFFYLQTGSRLLTAKAKLKYRNLSNYFYKPFLSMNELLNVNSCSYSMIDHPMSIQSGLTIRTFETLAAGLDLYTTNKEILNEPFYNPNRIHLIDQDLSDFDFNIADRSSFDMEWQNEFKKYSVDNWIKTIFSF